MERIYGYVRISTKQQNIERQIRNILKIYPDAILYKEAFTGTQINRPVFDRLIQQLRENDTVVFDSVSRMSRDSKEGFNLYMELFEKGINLIFLKEPHINTSVYKEALKSQINVISNTGDDATDKLINSVINALKEFQLDLAKRQIDIAFQQSEKEVKDLRQRTKEGIETARRDGKQIGGVKGKKIITKKSKECKENIVKLSKDFEGNMKDKDLIKLLNIASNTYYKYKRELKTDSLS